MISALKAFLSPIVNLRSSAGGVRTIDRRICGGPKPRRAQGISSSTVF
jgi:hypothetical protein